MGAIGRPEGHDAVLKALDDEDPMLRAEACRALGRLGRPDDAPHLTRIMMADQDGDCRIAAIEGLGVMKNSDPRIQLLLVDAMQHEDPAIRVAAVRSLRTLSGQDLGVDPDAWKTDVEARVAVFEGTPPPR